MCGRFYLDVAAGVLTDYFDISSILMDVADWRVRYNIAPGQDIAIVRDMGTARELTWARWGLVPHWSKEEKPKYSTINARAETLSEKPAYREPFKRKRCLIPASGFYEWQQTEGKKTPYLIRRPKGGLMAFAGLWDHWEKKGEGFDSCTIIVTQANRAMQALHERMPVLLESDQFQTWLNPESQNREELEPLLKPFAGALEMFPVSRYVNSPTHDDIRCIEPSG